jgi:hypothetical protein
MKHSARKLFLNESLDSCDPNWLKFILNLISLWDEFFQTSDQKFDVVPNF